MNLAACWGAGRCLATASGHSISRPATVSGTRAGGALVGCYATQHCGTAARRPGNQGPLQAATEPLRSRGPLTEGIVWWEDARLPDVSLIYALRLSITPALLPLFPSALHFISPSHRFDVSQPAVLT